MDYTNMSGKICKFCNETNLEWDQDHHARTGKWKLQNHKGCSNKDLRYGQDRCAACRYNGQRVCDMSLSKYKHQAKI